jgi:hypothetical protein
MAGNPATAVLLLGKALEDLGLGGLMRVGR